MLTIRAPWLLLSVELRVAWRALFRSAAAARGGVFLLALIIALAHAVAGLLVGLLPDATVDSRLTVAGYLSLEMAMLAILGFMASSSTVYALEAFFEKGAVDLVLASPTSAQAIFSSKALVIGARATAPFAVIVLPLANMAMWSGHAGFWGLYPMLLALGLTGSAIGIALAVLLVRAGGVAKARRKVFLMNVGLLALMAALLASWTTWVGPAIESVAVDARLGTMLNSVLSPDSWLWLPARAALGSFLAIAGLCSAALFLFRLLGAALADQYVAGLLVSRGISVRAPSRVCAGLGPYPIATKEWLLMRRSPDLFLQALLQSAALALMLTFFLRRDGGVSLERQAFDLLPSAAVVFIAALTGRIAWLVISAEEAAGLLATSPQSPQAIRFQKMGVALAVTLAPTVILGAWLATRSPAGAVWLLCMSTLANVCLAMLHAWNAGPGARRDVARRGKSMPLMLRLAEGAAITAWGAATYGLPRATWWGTLALVTAVIIPLISCFHRARKQPDGTY